MGNESKSRVEAYFAALEAPLAELPAPRRDEFLSEARAHLAAMVEARRADGLGEEAAWDEAMTEFGEAGEVGRALWRGWASSGQLESEGAPLSKREVARKFVWPLIVVLVFYPLMMLLLSSDRVSKAPFFLAIGLFLTGVGVFRSRRAGMQWTPSSITGVVLGIAQMLFIAAQLQWGASRYGTILLSCGMPLLLACWVFQWWLSKREQTKRPWKFGALYAKNPVAAEQSYRISPLIGWTMGSVMGCIGTIWMIPFFGPAVTLWFFVVQIVISVAGGVWLYRRK